MASDSSPACLNCVHAQWQTDRAGRRLARKWAGTCTYEVVLPPLPLCVTATTSRNHIWADSGANCPVYSPGPAPAVTPPTPTY